MLSFLVNALLQIGQCTLFSPVCFLPCRAACPEVVNVEEQLWLTAYGQGYLFLRTPRLALAVVAAVVVVEEKEEEMVEVEGESLEAPTDDGEGGSAEVALR